MKSECCSAPVIKNEMMLFCSECDKVCGMDIDVLRSGSFKPAPTCEKCGKQKLSVVCICMIENLKDFDTFMKDRKLHHKEVGCINDHVAKRALKEIVKDYIWKAIQDARINERKKLLEELRLECDRTENEGGRVLIDEYISKIKKV